MRALVIDDDPAILELVSQYLRLSARHDVQSVRSARSALEAIETADEPFDCFLVDIQMPGVDGITLVQLIRETPNYETTPIIMLTAMQDKQYLDKAFSAGATDYVSKPFDFVDLRDRLEAAQGLAHDKGVPHGLPRRPGQLPDAEKIGLADPISLTDVEMAIDYGEFENYVRQLLNRRLFRVSTIAVKIGSVDQVHRELTSDQFRTLVRDVALAAEKTLLSVGGILTYRGAGYFLCIPEKRLQGRRNAIQKALNKRFHAVHKPAGRTVPTLYVGDQVPLGSGSGAKVEDALGLAIESVETESKARGDFFEMPKRLLRRHLDDDGRDKPEGALDTLPRDALADLDRATLRRGQEGR